MDVCVRRRSNPYVGQYSVRQASINWQGVYDIIKQIYVVQLCKGAISQKDALTACDCDADRDRNSIIELTGHVCLRHIYFEVLTSHAVACF